MFTARTHTHSLSHVPLLRLLLLLLGRGDQAEHAAALAALVAEREALGSEVRSLAARLEAAEQERRAAGVAPAVPDAAPARAPGVAVRGAETQTDVAVEAVVGFGLCGEVVGKMSKWMERPNTFCLAG